MAAIKDTLDNFAFDVIEGAKKNLKRKKKNASKKLSNSLDFKLKVSNKKDKYTLSFFMEDYGEFIDKGVKGIGGKRNDGTTYKKKRVDSSSPFSYKKGIQNKPSRKHFDKWSIRKGIAPRSGGKFTTRIGLTTAISHSVWHTGLETTNFFSLSLKKEIKKLPDKLAEAVGTDLENIIKVSINNL